MEHLSYNSSPEKGRTRKHTELITIQETFKEGSQEVDNSTLQHYLSQYQEYKKNNLFQDDQQSQLSFDEYLKKMQYKDQIEKIQLNFSDQKEEIASDRYSDQLKIGQLDLYKNEPKSPTFFKEKITANSQEIQKTYQDQLKHFNNHIKRQIVCLKNFQKISKVFRDVQYNYEIKRQLKLFQKTSFRIKLKLIKKPKFTDDYSHFKNLLNKCKLKVFRFKIKYQKYKKNYFMSYLQFKKNSNFTKISQTYRKKKQIAISELFDINGEIRNKSNYGFGQFTQKTQNQKRDSLLATVERAPQSKQNISNNLINNIQDNQFKFDDRFDTQDGVFRKSLAINVDGKAQQVEFNNEAESQKSMKRFHIQSKSQLQKDHIQQRQQVQYTDEIDKAESDNEADYDDEMVNQHHHNDNLRSSQNFSTKQKYFAQKKKKDVTNKTQNASTLVNNSSSCYEDHLVISTLQFSTISQKEYLRNKQLTKQNQYYTSSEAETAAAKAHTMINSQNLSIFKSKLPLKMESHHDKHAQAKDLIQKPDETEEEQYSHSHDQQFEVGTQDQHIHDDLLSYPKIQDLRKGWDCHNQHKYSKLIAHNESFPKFKKRILRSYEVKRNNKFIVFDLKKRKSLSCHNDKNQIELTGGISIRNIKQSVSKIGLSDLKNNHHQFNEENYTQNKQTERFAIKNNLSNYNKTNDDCETLQLKMAIINISEIEPINEIKGSIISRNKSLQWNPCDDGNHQSIISHKQKFKENFDAHENEQDKNQNEIKNVQSKIFEFSQGLPTFRSQSNDFSLSNKNAFNNYQQIEVINVDNQEISVNLQLNLQECKDSFSTSQKNYTATNTVQDSKRNEFQNTNKKFTITKKVDIDNQIRMKAVTFTNNDFTDQILENEKLNQLQEQQNQIAEQDQSNLEVPLILNQKYKSELQQSKSYSQIIPATDNNMILSNNEYNQTFFVESPELKDIQVAIINEDNISKQDTALKFNEVQTHKKFDIKKQINTLDIFRQQSVAIQQDESHLNLRLSKIKKSKSMKELIMKEYNDPNSQLQINYEEEKQKTEMSNKQFQIQNVAIFKQNRRQFMRTHQNIKEILRSPLDNAKLNLGTRTVRSSNIEEAGTLEKQSPRDNYNYLQAEEMFQQINAIDQINENYIIDQRIQQILPLERHKFQNQEFQYENREEFESILEGQKQFNEIILENQSCPEKIERNIENDDLIRQYNQQTGTQSLQKQYFEQEDLDENSMVQVETQILKNRIKSEKFIFQNQSEADRIKQQEIDMPNYLEVSIKDVMNINNSASPKTNLTMDEQQKIKFQQYIEPQIIRKSNLFQHNSYQSDDQQQIQDIRDQEVEDNLQELQSAISNNLIQQDVQVEIPRKMNYSANDQKIKDKIVFEGNQVVTQQVIRKANSLYRIDLQTSPEKLIVNDNLLIEPDQLNQSIDKQIKLNEINELNGSSEEANAINYQQKTFHIKKSSLPYQLNENEKSLSDVNIKQNQIGMKVFKIENKDEINIKDSDGFIPKLKDKLYPQDSKNLQISIQKRKEDLNRLIQEDEEFQKQQSFNHDENTKKINQSFDNQKNIQKYNQKKINKSQYLTGEKQGKQDIINSRKKVDSQRTYIKKEIYEDIDEELMSENENVSLKSREQFNSNYIKYENQKLRQNIPQMDQFNQNFLSFTQQNNSPNDYQQFQNNIRDMNKNEQYFSQQSQLRNQNKRNRDVQRNMLNTPFFENNQSNSQKKNMHQNFQQHEQFEEPNMFNPHNEQQSDQQFQFKQYQTYKKFMNLKMQQQQSPFDFQYMSKFQNPSCSCQQYPYFQQPFQNYNNFQNFQQQYNEQGILSQMKHATINQINMNINYLKYIEQKEFQLKQIQEYQEFLEFQHFANSQK